MEKTGVPNNLQFLGKAECIRVLTTKTRFWYMYEDSTRADTISILGMFFIAGILLCV